LSQIPPLLQKLPTGYQGRPSNSVVKRITCFRPLEGVLTIFYRIRFQTQKCNSSIIPAYDPCSHRDYRVVALGLHLCNTSDPSSYGYAQDGLQEPSKLQWTWQDPQHLLLLAGPTADLNMPSIFVPTVLASNELKRRSDRP